MVNVTERAMFTILVTILLFLLLTFDVQFGLIFSLFLIANVLFYLLDNKITFHIKRPGTSILSIALWGLGGYFVFILAAPLILKTFGFTAPQSVIELLELYSQYIPFFSQISPILADNPILTILAFGVLVTVVETIFFNGRLYEAITDLLRINTSTFNPRNILVGLGVIPAIATAFHFSVRGVDIAATPGLLLTFIFFAVGQFIVIKRRQIIDAIGMHTIANTTTMVVTLGLSSLSPILMPIIFIGVLFIILRTGVVQKIIQKY